MDPELKGQAEEAIRRLRAALDKGSDLRHEELHAAIAEVFAFRNRILDGYRAGRCPRDLLDRANAVTSLAYGTEFPLSGLHAHRIEQTCAALRDVLQPGAKDAPDDARPDG